MSEERAKILQMVADGKISAEQATQLLATLPEEQVGMGAAEDEPAPPMEKPDFGKPWLILAYVGLVSLVCGALAVFAMYGTGGSWLWALCGWPLYLAGLAIVIVAWLSRRWRWLHVRVFNINDAPFRSLRFSFPLPLRLAAWGLRVGGRFVPQLQRTGVDEIITAVNDGLRSDEPLFIDVQDDEDGERVQMYIG